MQAHKHTEHRTYKHAGTQAHRHTEHRTYKHAGTQAHRIQNLASRIAQQKRAAVELQSIYFQYKILYQSYAPFY